MAETVELEQLVRELNDPRNQSAPEVIDAIQKRIQTIQRVPLAWQWGMDLLNHSEAMMRFYGALTLTIKINADWDGDKVGEDRNLINHLLRSLVSSYVRLASIPDVSFVLQKLCTTLVTVFQKPQSAWALPIRHLTACTVAGQTLPQDAAPPLEVSLGSGGTISGAQLRSLLMFPMTLAEQDSIITGSVKEHNVRVRISNNVPDILRLLHFAATSLSSNRNESAPIASPFYGLSVTYDNSQFLDTARTLLQLVPLWTSEIKAKGTRKDDSVTESNFDVFKATVQVFPYLFQQVPLASAVLQAFTALEESSHKLLQNALARYEEDIITSLQAKSWIQQLVSGDFDSDALSYMNFLEACMNQVDVTSPEYLSSGFYIEILKQAQILLQCEGAPGIDDTVCQVALEIITSVTEGFSDWPEPSLYDGSMRELIKAACDSALKKIRIPLEELNIRTQTWDTDDRAKFQDFRYDVHDYFQNAFSILGDSLIDKITGTIVEANLSAEWDVFEAGLFSFIAFSDTFANEHERFDTYLAAVFDCGKWHTAVHAEINVPDRVRQIMIKVIGENTGFLQRHTDFLVPSLNFLFTSLHMESSATAASRAISTLCDAQRSMLTEALPHFMNSLNDTSSIEPDAKHRIYAAVGAIVQALPSEDAKVQPLTQILYQLMEQDFQNEVDLATSHHDLVSKAVDVLQTIATLGRGLRAPSDASIDLERNGDVDSRFWIEGSGAVVQQQVLHIHGTLLQHTKGQDNDSFVEAACGFLRSGFTEEHPSPFKFANTKVLELLSIYLQLSCPQPDHVMSTASSYLASVKPADPDHEFHTLFLMSMHVVNDAFVSHKTHSQPLSSDFCTAALDFYARLLPKWALSLFRLPEAQDALALIIELTLLLVEDPDTLPRRMAASFLTSLLEASGQTRVINDPEATSAITATLQTFFPRIIASVIHLLGGVCARSDIDALTETVKKAVQKQPMMANRLLKEALKDENAVLTAKALQATKPEQRARFASQIEMLRGARKTNEVVREFWIACKGREFEYVT